jgi:hypothetical protein
VPLRYLWKARQQTPTAEPTSQNDFEPLLGELGKAIEDQLLNLKYSFFDKNNRKYVTQRVRDTLQAAVTQLGGYMDVISRRSVSTWHFSILTSEFAAKMEVWTCFGVYYHMCWWHAGYMQAHGDETY